MTNREIYEGALAMIAEDSGEGDTDDYEERAPYIIASFCALTESINKGICLSESTTPPSNINPVCLALDSTFPFNQRLAQPAVLYTAAMLVIDEDMDLSDSLYEKYCDSISSISDSFPCSLESITNRYL